MRNSIAIGVLCVVGSFGAVMAAPSAELSSPVQGIANITHAEAAVSRGGAEEGGGGGNATQGGANAAHLLQHWFTPLLFVLTAIGIGAASLQRNAGQVVLIVVLALLIGAFLLVPTQMEGWFKQIYQVLL
jgi:hypothetical protein